jgi:hypothetical protein
MNVRVILSAILSIIIFFCNAQNINKDSLFKAEMRAEKKLYNEARVRIILIGLPYMAMTTGVNLTLANFYTKPIQYAYVSVKGIDTSGHIVGTEVCNMKGPIKPNMEMEEDFGTLFYLTPIDSYEISKVVLQYTDGTKWTVPPSLLPKVCTLHKSQEEIDEIVRKAMRGQ